MKYFQNKYWFTLIELLIAIAIISIMTLSISSINYDRLSSKQKNEIFINKIKTDFETIRNYSLSGKWIWTELIVPEKWQIDFSNTSSWKIETKYMSGWTLYTYNNLNFIDWKEISFIKCLRLNKTEDNEITSWTWIIKIEWDKLILTWSCNITTSKILQIWVSFRWNEEILNINTLNWLVEIK